VQALPRPQCPGPEQHTPRLAGQLGEYLPRTLQAFRQGDPSLAPSPMQQDAADVSDDDLKAVVAHLSDL